MLTVRLPLPRRDSEIRRLTLVRLTLHTTKPKKPTKSKTRFTRLLKRTRRIRPTNGPLKRDFTKLPLLSPKTFTRKLSKLTMPTSL